ELRFSLERASRVPMKKLFAGDVYCERQSNVHVAPSAQLTTDAANQQLAHLDDESAFLGDGNEFARGDHAELFVVPPSQDFGAYHLLIREAELGLKLEGERLHLQRASQASFGAYELRHPR